MELKKAIYFTLDSIIAGAIILSVIAIVSSFYVEEESTNINYLSQDLITVLGSLTVKEINNQYIKSLIDDGTIKNFDNTILEQIGEFWLDGKTDTANKTVSNITAPWIANSTGFGVWVNNNTIYQRDLPIQKKLVSSKKIVSGIVKEPSGQNTRQNPPSLNNSVIVEVRVWQ